MEWKLIRDEIYESTEWAGPGAISLHSLSSFHTFYANAKSDHNRLQIIKKEPFQTSLQEYV